MFYPEFETLYMKVIMTDLFTFIDWCFISYLLVKNILRLNGKLDRILMKMTQTTIFIVNTIILLLYLIITNISSAILVYH